MNRYRCHQIRVTKLDTEDSETRLGFRVTFFFHNLLVNYTDIYILGIINKRFSRKNTTMFDYIRK